MPEKSSASQPDRLSALLTLEAAGELPPDHQQALTTLRAAGEIPQLPGQSQPGFGTLSVPEAPGFGYHLPAAMGGLIGQLLGGAEGGPMGAAVGGGLGAGAGGMLNRNVREAIGARVVPGDIRTQAGMDALLQGVAPEALGAIPFINRPLRAMVPTSRLLPYLGGARFLGLPTDVSVGLGTTIGGLRAAEATGLGPIGMNAARSQATAMTQQLQKEVTKAAAELSPQGQAVLAPVLQNFSPQSFLDVFSRPDFRRIFRGADKTIMTNLSAQVRRVGKALTQSTQPFLPKFVAQRALPQASVAGGRAIAEE